MHVEIKYLPQILNEKSRKYLFVAIDCASRWVYFVIFAEKFASNAASFLKRLIDKAHFRIKIVFTNSGREFTDKFYRIGQRRS